MVLSGGLFRDILGRLNDEVPRFMLSGAFEDLELLEVGHLHLEFQLLKLLLALFVGLERLLAPLV